MLIDGVRIELRPKHCGETDTSLELTDVKFACVVKAQTVNIAS